MFVPTKGLYFQHDDRHTEVDDEQEKRLDLQICVTSCCLLVVVYLLLFTVGFKLDGGILPRSACVVCGG